MTWKAYHSRGETLRAVIAASAVRRDGLLPMDVDGVTETFADELDLLGALTLKWHTRLAGQIEAMLAHQPMNLDEAVAIAWSNTAHLLPGVRLILDHYRDEPTSDAMARAMRAATAKERHLLAVNAGRASISGEGARRVGAVLEERARELHRELPPIAPDVAFADPADAVEPQPRGSLLERLRAFVAA
ncbi:hypothetical protein JK386_12955 [Nocardioides sp. zg-536]|uniref:Uncharacterized protein n=1 Tax=Nocardioides faecalis TaxID=2803858 RepID=A0A939BWN0_9ACTN|nr:hypothetical protein [Nocardioides faecalis]MBM9460812.1 hypothetical protein [Nocardioides faecalis]QVI58001.1 hypothetical protein KG111_13330 [Nocardioides faecalis]